MSNVALVVIDVQIGMFEELEGPSENAAATLENISRLVEEARFSGVDVVFVQHCEEAGTFVPGTRLFEIHPDLNPADGEPVIRKWTPDSFHETDLKEALDARGIENLVLRDREPRPLWDADGVLRGCQPAAGCPASATG